MKMKLRTIEDGDEEVPNSVLSSFDRIMNIKKEEWNHDNE